MAGWIQRLGDPSIVTATDSLFVATTAADGDYLSQLARFVWSGQIGADRLTALTAREARARENALSSRVRGGYLARGKVRLTTTYSCAGCATRWPMPGCSGTHADRRRLRVSADQVLVAAGWGRPRCYPTSPSSPRRADPAAGGQPDVDPAAAHVIRARVDGRNLYLVPRADGVVVGATQYEPASSHDPAPQAGRVADLLADAFEVMPGLRTYDFAEAAAGVRPCSADGLPVIERVDDRTLVATGHGRNGIVLAPVTASRVLDLLGG